jgi:type I restriction enzyme S subunit
MVASMGATRKARGWTAGESGVDRYIGLEHLDSNSLKIRRWGSPDDVGANSDLRHFEPGDVILARRRIYQRKIGVAEFYGVASGHALVFRAKREVVLPEFLAFFMQSDAFMGRADRFSAGSLSETVNLSSLMNEEFALPPLNRIAVIRIQDS